MRIVLYLVYIQKVLKIYNEFYVEPKWMKYKSQLMSLFYKLRDYYKDYNVWKLVTGRGWIFKLIRQCGS